VELEKVTKQRQDDEKRRYDDACAAAHGMDLLGDRWAMPVMRELLLGPRRFGDLKASLRTISANVLTQRLEGLEAAGIVVRRKLPPPASVQVYELTPWGYESAPVFAALGRWAVRSPRHDPTRPFSRVSLMLSLRTMFSAEAAGDFVARIQLRMGEESFFWIRESGAVAIGRGEIDNPDVIVTGDQSEIAAVVYTGAPLETVSAEGDVALFKRFITLFPLPPKAG
jgi:DNA-binding HxlR family transcriptional regulator